MYERMRTEILTELSAHYSIDDINKISNIIDKIANNYIISEKTTELSIYEGKNEQILKMYLASKYIESISPNTIKMYKGIIEIMLNRINLPIEEITVNDIRLFLAQYQMLRKISDRSMDKYRQVLHCFFEWCVNEEFIQKNPCKNIKEIRYEVKPRKALTRYQLEQVRRICKSKRDLAIVDVLYSTGCRVTELINMKFEDMNNDCIHIVGKGKKDNTVYLNTNAKLSLEDYLNLERKGNSDYIFVSERKPYGQLSARTIQVLFKSFANELHYSLSPHIIRHTSATLALKNGMSITQVQKMLGHTSVATTQIYAETSQEDVAIAHQKYVI